MTQAAQAGRAVRDFVELVGGGDPADFLLAPRPRRRHSRGSLTPGRTVRDETEVPRYAVGEAALYLRLPRATLKTWVHGRVDQNGHQAEPVIKLPASSGLLSFQNLVEAHVLGAIRRQHGVSLQRVRKALRFVQRKIQQPHPLITVEFQTDGVDLFVKELGRLINASGAGQTEIDEAIRKSLARIDAAGEQVGVHDDHFARDASDETWLGEVPAGSRERRDRSPFVQPPEIVRSGRVELPQS